MLRLKFAPFVVLSLLAPGHALAADRNDGSTADLPCNSLCQRWMGLGASPEPEAKPLATVDLHPAPAASVSAPPAPVASPPLPPRRRNADRTDGGEHRGLKSTVLAKVVPPPAAHAASADAVPPAAMNVLGRSMVSAERAQVALAEEPARGAAAQAPFVAIPNLPVAAWTAPVSTPQRVVPAAAEQVVRLPDLPPVPPPPSREDVVAMLPAPTPVATASRSPPPTAPAAASVAAGATMPPAFDVIAALMLDGARPSSHEKPVP